MFGTFFNFLNIIVLGHKEMRGNPIYLILFSIAVADILLMLEYIPFTVHMYILMQNVDRDREDKVRVLQSRSVIVTLYCVYSAVFTAFLCQS